MAKSSNGEQESGFRSISISANFWRSKLLYFASTFMKSLPAFALLGIAVLLGCDKQSSPTPMPELHPVKGQVFRNGQPVSGGYLTLRSDTNLNYMVSAKVESDGRFVAFTADTTRNDAKREPGAPTGSYRGEYAPPSTEQSIQPISLKLPVVIKVGENDLKIDLPKK